MNNKPFSNTVVEFHILQSFPVSCLNRDDLGSPKSAIIGGVERARVSSQCWKRAVRLALHEQGVRLATRTRKVNECLIYSCIDCGADEQQAKEVAEVMAKQIVEDTLHFFSAKEAQALAQLAKSYEFKAAEMAGKKFLKEIVKVCKKERVAALDGLDLALFGRMVAKTADLNIEAASSFAHAISTHKVSSELEFFTGLDDQIQTTGDQLDMFTLLDKDDKKDEQQGAAHMGTLEFNSATYYRYVSLNLGQLYQNLADDDLGKAIEVFTKALFVAQPTARQHSQSAASFWDYARVLVRKGQRLQICFEQAVTSKGEEGYLYNSAKELDAQLARKEDAAGSLFGKQADYCLSSLSDKHPCPDSSQAVNIDGLVAALAQHGKVSQE